MGLDGSTCSECPPVVTCDFEPPDHVPRTSARAHTCNVVTLVPWCSGGLPACLRAESTRKDPRPEEKKMPMCKKNTFIDSTKTRNETGDTLLSSPFFLAPLSLAAFPTRAKGGTNLYLVFYRIFLFFYLYVHAYIKPGI